MQNYRTDENLWIKLPDADGSILTVEVADPYSNPGQTDVSERFVPGNSGHWVDEGALPADTTNDTDGIQLFKYLSNEGSWETGSAALLPGTHYAIFFGGSGTTALYDWSNHTWAAGPNIRGADGTFYGSLDSPAAAEANGKILVAVGSTSDFGSFTKLMEYDPNADFRVNPNADPGANPFTEVSAVNGPDLSNVSPFVMRMLALPNGQILVHTGGINFWVYTPDAPSQAQLAATGAQVTSVVDKKLVDGGRFLYSLSGYRLNGPTDGAYYGDDAQMSSAFPIITATDASSGAVDVARTTSWSSTSLDPTTLETVNFEGLSAPGVYLLSVSGAGVQSLPTLFIRFPDIQSGMQSATLTLTQEVQGPFGAIVQNIGVSDGTYTGTFPASQLGGIFVDGGGFSTDSLTLDLSAATLPLPVPLIFQGSFTGSVQNPTPTGSLHIIRESGATTGVTLTPSQIAIDGQTISYTYAPAIEIDGGAAYPLTVDERNGTGAISSSGVAFANLSTLGPITVEEDSALNNTASTNATSINLSGGTITYPAAQSTAFAFGAGNDTLNINGTITPAPTFTGTGSDTIIVNAGTFRPTGDVASGTPNGLTINDYASLALAAHDQHITTLYIASGAIASMAVTSAPNMDVLYLGSLTIIAGGTLDMGNAKAFITYGAGTDPMNVTDHTKSIFYLLGTGFNGGAWNGGGIDSSAAAANPLQRTGIGYADSADGLIAGKPVNTIELTYVLYGDTNLDGSVDFNDFTRFDQHYGQTSGGAWDTGDFNYDGSVNSSDFDLISRAYGLNINFSLAPQSTSAAGLDPHAIAVADLNGDGSPDVAVPDFWASIVSVLLSNGNGTFQAARTVAVGDTPSDVAIADVNNDGKPDLIVTNKLQNTVSVLLGNGDGTFQPQAVLTVRGQPNEVAAGDLNGDGKPDLAISRSVLHGSIVVLLGNGDGTFQAPQTVLSVAWPSSLAIADVNGDGKPDLLVTSEYGYSNIVGVVLGNGDGTFGAQTTFATGQTPGSLVVTDVNGDGKPDLVVANYGDSDVGVLLGNGNGTFQPQQTFAGGGQAVAAADLNGDGNVDLVSIARNCGVYVLLGNGNGTFQAAQTFSVTSGPYALAFADVNGDGRPDILLADYNGNSITVLLNTSGE